MISLTFGDVVNDFIHLFYPDCCSACSAALVKGERIICTECLISLPQTNYHLEPENLLRRRLEGRLPVTDVLAFLKFTKNGKIQRLLHNLKYRRQPEIGIALGKLYGHRLRDAGVKLGADMLVPVPLHASRLRKRGYNQSGKFAEGLSEVLGIPVREEVLLRKTRTDTQTRKNKLRRWENVSEVFAVADEAAIKGRHILIADDVITTGATVEACGQVLLASGAEKVSIVCIAEA
jgi:ComF family protein